MTGFTNQEMYVQHVSFNVRNTVMCVSMEFANYVIWATNQIKQEMIVNQYVVINQLFKMKNVMMAIQSLKTGAMNVSINVRIPAWNAVKECAIDVKLDGNGNLRLLDANQFVEMD